MTDRRCNGRLPDFLIAGAQKAGSTWLPRNLAQHPDIFMPPKELHFFDINSNYKRGITWYTDKFDTATSQQIVGEKTPNYLDIYRSSSELPIAERIYAHLPRAKIFFILRNPIERAISALRHHMFFGRIPSHVPVEELFFGTYRDRIDHWNVLSGGLYARNIKRYLETFGEQQVRIFVFEEDIRTNPEATFSDAQEFIGISPENIIAPMKSPSNVGMKSKISFLLNKKLPTFNPLWQSMDRFLPRSWDVRASPECLARLREYYNDENKELYRILGRTIRSWEVDDAG